MNLDSLGWSAHFDSDDLDLNYVARILAVHRSHMRAAGAKGELNIIRSGQSPESISVGDWVTFSPPFIDEQGEPAAIALSVLARKTKLSRATDHGEQLIAANVDSVFVVTSANHDLNINRLHRYLVLINESGSTPIVVLSKTDLVDNHEKLVEKIVQKTGVQVLSTSVVDNSGIHQVLELMPQGSTSVFVGSSGVGKSSLVNSLLGGEVQLVQTIREDDSKGRHTTTGRQMFEVPGHGMIIDTPGVREVQVFGDSESLGETFPFIEQLSQECRFVDCNHSSEPGCAIREAIDAGTLELKEWESFLKLEREMAHQNNKMSKVTASNAKKRWKKITMANKHRQKVTGR